jgi:cytochrome P450
MLDKVGENEAFATATDKDVVQGMKPVFGPLSKAVVNASKDLDMNLYDQFGNMLLILFAGHDTTAHTMTWLTYELARNPHYQKRVQQEVDAMFDGLGGKPMQYEDCAQLPFLTKCVMETLRKWTAVPNGTFRELQYEDEIHGPGK